MLLDYIKVFFVGGVICLIAQILMDYFKIQSPYILVSYVTSGVILSFLGIYQYIVDFGGAGATVPIIGFGHTLANGVKTAIAKMPIHAGKGIFSISAAKPPCTPVQMTKERQVNVTT